MTARESVKGSARKPGGGARSIKIRLVRGTIACDPKQRAAVRGLGLKRREQMVELENTPSVRGMIKRVLHLVEVVDECR